MQNSNRFTRASTLRAGLLCSTILGLAFVTEAQAQTTNLGTVEVEANKSTTPTASPNAVGSQAAPGSAPALAPAQGNLNATEPGSIVSDKVITDVIKPVGNYLDVIQFTPGTYITNPNGSGDAKGGFRGFADGQYNVTYDGVPFGDANDPSHHTGSYFPAPFIGSVVVDRGPGKADQPGYATFGGTIALYSPEVSDKFGGSVSQSFGNFNTFETAIRLNSGILNPSGTKFQIDYSHKNTDGVLQYGRDNSTFGQIKIVQPLENFTITGFANYGQQYYNATSAITSAQIAAFGKNFGGLNNNPKTNNFFGYNNSIKQTDMEYLDLKGDLNGFTINNKVYTYAYGYPNIQNNGFDINCNGTDNTGSGATAGVVCPATFTKLGNKATIGTFNVVGQASPNDVGGYKQINNYRGYGDIFSVAHEIDAGILSGTAKTGIWLEQVDNQRRQQYFDYTTQQYLTSIGNSPGVGYKLDLWSHITEVQPFAQYEWRPIAGLAITPGFKFESFERKHDATINQTTLVPANFDKTYTADLPYLDIRYKFNNEWTGYVQGSQGFLAPPVAAYYVTNAAFAEGGVQPERTTNYQAGVIFKNNTITADADIYEVNATHFSTTTTDSNGNTFYVDGGNAYYRGIEGELTYALTKGWAAYLAGSYSSARFAAGSASAGLAVPDAPNYTAALGSIYDDGTYFGSALMKFVGDQYGSKGQIANVSVNKVSPYNTTDVALGARTDYFNQFNTGIKKTELKVGISNLFDHRSIVDIGGSTAAAATYSFQASRTWYVQVKAEF